MHVNKIHRRWPRYIHPSQENGEKPNSRFPRFLLLLAALLLFAALAGLFLQELSSQIAVSDARDIVTAEVNRVIAETLREGDYGSDYFVSFEKNELGEVTALSCNMAHINVLSAQILEQVIGRTENRVLTIAIPSGNLTGVSLLMGRGPDVPVQIIMLTSSRVEFGNSVLTAGINQTKHQISLRVIVDIDVLVPWGSESTEVTIEVLIADTMVIGQVPNAYFHMQE